MAIDWVRLDTNRVSEVGIYIQTEPHWTGNYHGHSDKIQWIMPITGEYGIVTSEMNRVDIREKSHQPLVVTARSAAIIPVHSVLVIPPGIMHLHVTQHNPVVLLVSMTRSVWDDLLSKWTTEGGDVPRLNCPETLVSNELRALMNKIHEAATQVHLPCSSMLLDCLTTQLAIAWLRQTRLGDLTFLHRDAIEELCFKLSQDPGYPWTIDDMARKTALSSSQLLRSFKNVMNTTPYRYLSQLRLEHAVHQLTHSSKSIDVVSEESGFGSRRGLEVALKAYCGVSPAEIRKRSSEAHPPG